jgi:DNA-binding NtrC family response regulator
LALSESSPGPPATAGRFLGARKTGSVDEALEQLAFAEIVATDLELGNGSGVELIEAIGARFPQLPVIAMTGKPALLKEATHCGALAVLAKPFDLEQPRAVTTIASVAVTIGETQAHDAPCRDRSA